MSYVTRAIPLLCMLSACAAAGAQELTDVLSNCEGCHGENGVSQWDDMPTIAGIDAFTHSEALYVYRDQERPCSDSKYRRGDTSRAATNMCAVTADLTDEQIEAIAAHYSELEFVPAKQAFDAALAEAGAAIHKSECDRCHTEGGSNVEDEASILAGQWMGYLKQSFAQYASGERPQPKQMQEKMDPLSDDDINALIHYYASQQ